MQCPGCQVIAEAMVNWSNGLLSNTFEVRLGNFAGFEERRNCNVCQYVVRHFNIDPTCHPLRPSCALIFSRVDLIGTFWIEPVSLPSASLLYTMCSVH